jgi:cation diffusion facilitator family transporter
MSAPDGGAPVAPPDITTTSRQSERESRAQWRAMRWSLAIGILMLVGKGAAWIITGSADILSDAAESVVHVVAVGFAAWSLRLSQQPPDQEHPYGHEKVNYFSAGAEGALIAMAAIFILSESIRKIVEGPEIQNPGWGGLIITAATVINALLGWYLVRVGRREGSLILVANGTHVLTDSLTSLGAIVALILVVVTGWVYFDPVIAMILAANILVSGFGLVRQSVHGLMDRRDPDVDRRLREILDQWAVQSGGAYHGLRHRSGGHVVWMDVHLLLPAGSDLEHAHASATDLEQQVQRGFPDYRLEITSHLEPLEAHGEHHPEGGPQHT